MSPLYSYLGLKDFACITSWFGQQKVGYLPRRNEQGKVSFNGITWQTAISYFKES